MPNVRQVSIALRDDRPRRVPLHAIEMVVDDGQPTPLEMKGDGVQSLAAVALLRRSAMDRSRASSFVLAVEEPEAHLHPLAIRELRQVLSQIAEDQQVVVTTHSPLLADPLRVDCNTIVQGNAVRPARTFAEVRDSLGVRLEDNLQSARLSLVV
ncbi:MAG: ATP-binding protein, partial [Chloroflexi bacterium]|nr:ATP-binding protein [Chloroflexota bacterium]